MKKIIPVIHFVGYDKLIQNIETCLSLDINQVFIINHTSNYKNLLNDAFLIREKYPNLWIGLNFLDLSPKESLSMDIPFNALWIDDTLNIEDVKDKKFKGDIFSGLNFKYQKQYSGNELNEVVNIVKQTSTIATTSGNGTGISAPLDKVKNLKNLLGNFPLALASGINSTNIESYLPYIDTFLIASSITDENEIIQKKLLKELIEKLL